MNDPYEIMVMFTNMPDESDDSEMERYIQTDIKASCISFKI